MNYEKMTDDVEIVISQIQYNAWRARCGVNTLTCYVSIDGKRDYVGRAAGKSVV